jgi:hypothetical protein
MQKKNRQEEGQQHSLLISPPTTVGDQQQETLQKTLQSYARKLQNAPIPNEKAAKGILKITYKNFQKFALIMIHKFIGHSCWKFMKQKCWTILN